VSRSRRRRPTWRGVLGAGRSRAPRSRSWFRGSSRSGTRSSGPRRRCSGSCSAASSSCSWWPARTWPASSWCARRRMQTELAVRRAIGSGSGALLALVLGEALLPRRRGRRWAVAGDDRLGRRAARGPALALPRLARGRDRRARPGVRLRPSRWPARSRVGLLPCCVHAVPRSRRSCAAGHRRRAFGRPASRTLWWSRRSRSASCWWRPRAS
jgi:hypothetical protein